MFKKMLAVILSLAVITLGYAADASAGEVSEVFANEDILAEEPLEVLKLEEELPEAIEVAGMSDASLPAKSAILLDQLQGTVLYEKNADEQLPPASITKVMTLLLAMEALESGRIKIDDIVTASDYACSMGGSQIWLKPGEQMTVEEMLKAICIVSANDASVAVGEHIAGTNDAFIDMMNKRAQELGMNNTHFLNCTGLDEAGHLTTARDIAIMSRELMKHNGIKEYTTIWMDTLRNGEIELVNTNRLVRFYGGTTGLKTGTTNGAGSCLSATAERDGLGLVSVVMGCPTSDERFASARSLLDYGFANYMVAEAPSIDDKLYPVKVIHGVESFVDVTYQSPGGFVVSKQGKDLIVQEVTLAEDVEAPVYEGQTLGSVDIIIDGIKVSYYEIKAKTDCEKMTITKALALLIKAMLNMSGKDSIPEHTVPEPVQNETPSDMQKPQEENISSVAQAAGFIQNI